MKRSWMSRTGVRHSMESWHGTLQGVERHAVHKTTLSTKPDHLTQRKRDQKIPVVGVRVSVHVCACVKWGSDLVSHRGVEVLS